MLFAASFAHVDDARHRVQHVSSKFTLFWMPIISQTCWIGDEVVPEEFFVLWIIVNSVNQVPQCFTACTKIFHISISTAILKPSINAVEFSNGLCWGEREGNFMFRAKCLWPYIFCRILGSFHYTNIDIKAFVVAIKTSRGVPVLP